MRLYSHQLSGNCHKVRLLLGFLGLDYEEYLVDFEGAEHQQAPFLALNPAGTIPVLDDDGTVIADSQAILVYLGAKHGAGAWAPADPAGLGLMTRWLAFACNEIQHGPNLARLHHLLGLPVDMASVTALSEKVLRILDGQLDGRDWLVGERITLADLACAPYVALAPEGGIPLGPYGNVEAWLRRIEAKPGFTPMPGWGAFNSGHK